VFLQSLKLTGFKTFASPTTIEFSSGITAIVGANGSGKSNLVDALRWVLGEQSSRDLRARRSEDVIFAGGHGRKPASLAEVRVQFSGAEADNGGEAEIVRRLYRSGESEYVLNGSRARLRDIVDFARVHGLFSGGHTIVGQGMVDGALSVRGVERRGYVAAAAGVTAYEAKRAETARSLENARRNVGETIALCEQLDARLRVLKRQASIARGAAQSRADLNAALETHYAIRWEESQAVAARLKSDIAGSTDKATVIREEIVSLEEQIRRLQERIDNLRTAQEEQRAAVMATEFAMGRAADVVQVAKAGATNKQSEVAELAARVKALAADTSIREQVGAAETYLVQLNQRLEAQDRRGKELANAAVAAFVEVERVRELFTKSSEGIRELLESESTLRRTLADLESRRDMQIQLGSDAKERLPMSQDAVAVSREVVRNFGTVEAQAERKLLEERSSFEAAEAELETARQEFSRQQAEYDQDLGEMAHVSARLNAMTGTSVGAQDQMIRNLSFSRELADAVASVLGVLTDLPTRPDPGVPGIRPADRPEDRWKTSVRETVRKNGVDALGWLDDLISTSEPGLENILASTLVVPSGSPIDALFESIGSSTSLPVSVPAFGLVDLDGNYRSAGRFIRPLTAASESASRRAAFRELEDRFKDLQRITAVRSEALTVSKAALDARQCTLDSARDQVSTASASLAEVRARRVHEREMLAGHERMVLALSQQVASAEETLEVTRTQIVETEDGITRVRERIDGAEADLATVRDELRLAEESAAEARANNESIESDRDLLVRQIALEKVSLDRLRAVATAHDGELRELSERLRQTEIESEQSRGAIRQAEAGFRRAQADYEDAVRVLTESAVAREDGDAVDQGRGRLQALRERIDALRGDLQTQFGAIERQRANLEHVESDLGRIATECELDLGKHPSELTMGAGVAPTDVEIRRLRIRVEQAEEVQPGIVEEYDGLEQQRDTLEFQIRDLETAADKLRAILVETDREVRRRFQLAFAEVNEYFREFVPAIFNGGSGDLVLESIDGIESVEVAVSLPGKRSRDLASLSGGERTMVAGAFLFALVAASPPPLCVLDEVDAALDETNVDRYLGILKHLAQSTQFVVVTHNRGTMSAADTLFGIVIDGERGSRALSLRLDQFAS
jgi:chromosome segregation protein